MEDVPQPTVFAPMFTGFAKRFLRPSASGHDRGPRLPSSSLCYEMKPICKDGHQEENAKHAIQCWILDLEGVQFPLTMRQAHHVQAEISRKSRRATPDEKEQWWFFSEE